MASALKIAIFLAFGLPALAHSAPPEAMPLVDGLPGPVLLAVWPGDEPRLLVCERETGKASLVDPTRDAPTPQSVGELVSGATAMAFLDERTLLIGAGGPQRDDRRVHVFRVSARGPRPFLPRQRVGELLPEDAGDPLGFVTGLATNSRHVFASIAGPEDESSGGRLLRARHTASMLSAFRPLATAEATTLQQRAVAVSDHGYIVSLAGDDDSGSSRLLLAAPEPLPGAGDYVALDLPLDGVIALAYSPAPQPIEHRLYALAKPKGDPPGVYRLDAAADQRGVSAKATLVIELSEPTSMAFGAEGVLYVATAGEAGAAVMMVTGEL